MYFFEEDADRIDGFLVEDTVREYGDCRVKTIQNDTKVDVTHLEDDDSIISFCEIELVCDSIESFELVIAQLERRYGLVPYKTDYGD